MRARLHVLSASAVRVGPAPVLAGPLPREVPLGVTPAHQAPYDQPPGAFDQPRRRPRPRRTRPARRGWWRWPSPAGGPQPALVVRPDTERSPGSAPGWAPSVPSCLLPSGPVQLGEDPAVGIACRGGLRVGVDGWLRQHLDHGRRHHGAPRAAPARSLTSAPCAREPAAQPTAGAASTISTAATSAAYASARSVLRRSGFRRQRHKPLIIRIIRTSFDNPLPHSWIPHGEAGYARIR